MCEAQVLARSTRLLLFKVGLLWGYGHAQYTTGSGTHLELPDDDLPCVLPVDLPRG